MVYFDGHPGVGVPGPLRSLSKLLEHSNEEGHRHRRHTPPLMAAWQARDIQEEDTWCVEGTAFARARKGAEEAYGRAGGSCGGRMQNRYYGNRGSCERVIEATDSGWSEPTVVARYG